MSYLANFHHQITGPKNGQKLVFLHGIMGFGANWRTIAKAFEDRFEVLTFDQRGHGRSFQPAIGYAPEDYSEDLKAILDELGWQKIFLVGHSMGGRNALQFAHDYPQQVEKLVIEDIGPSMNHVGVSFIQSIVDTVPVPFKDKRAAREYFDTEFQKQFADASNAKGLAEYLYANIIEDEDKQAIWRFYEPGIRESLEQGRAFERWDELKALSMPTLLVRGELSKDLPRVIYEQMLACNSKITGVEIAGAGHWVHSDKPQEFIAALTSFFR